MTTRFRPDCAALLLWLGLCAAAAAAPDCRPMRIVEPEFEGPAQFEEGLLWRVSRPGREPNYVFGTIHVADEEIIGLLDQVQGALAESGTFVMEVLPEPSQIVLLTELMFFQDEQRLDGMVPPALFSRTAQILDAYHVPEEVVRQMKPWAAFLTMSYPADMRAVMDIELLRKAQASGVEVTGLETLEEQGSLFNDMEIADQVQLLSDTVCNYELVAKDFELMKQLYMKRNLRDLYVHAQRYSFDDNSLYERLTERLLTDRNHRMVERMEALLAQGDAFVAIGAMHLPGPEGVLALLASRRYAISRVF